MPRLTPLPTDHGFLNKRSQRWSQKQYGQPMEPIGIAAHSRPVLVGQALMELQVRRYQHLDERLGHLANLKTAALIGCHFCIDLGSKLVEESGMPAEQVLDLHRYATSPHFTPIERLVCEYVEAMTATPGAVTDDLFARLREHFDEPELVELTSVIAWENYRARFNDAFGIGSAGFSETCAIANRDLVAAPA